MGTSAEIYEYEKTLERTLDRVRESNIAKPDKLLIEKFSRYLFAESLSLGRIIKYLIQIRKIAESVRKPFSELTKEDIVDIVQKIERRKDYTEWTKHDYKLTLKKFFKFLRGTEDYPNEVKWIKLTTHNNKRLLPEELLTEDEVNSMADVARTPRDKALILVLYESGCRIGELLSLKIKNVRFDEYGAVLTVNGKTGMRRVRIIASVPALATWLDNHPLKGKSNSPLWVSLGTRNRDGPLKYRAVSDLLKRVAKQARINKRIYPHLFRHSRATKLANHLTEAQLKQHFGWVQSSDMASIYVHLSGRDVDKALLKLHGIEIDDEEKEEKFNVKECPRCKAKNSPIAKFCNTCGLPLDVKTAIELEKRKKEFIANTINPEIIEKMIGEKVRQILKHETD